MVVGPQEFVAIAFILGGIFGYFVRIEKRLDKITNDIAWIKRELKLCRQSSGDLTE